MRQHDEREGQRWRRRPFQAMVLRAFAFVAPIVASVAAVAVASRLLPEPESTSALVGWWVALSVLGMATLLAVDRLTRRLLPLAALLKLSLAFPDQAPSRFAVALRSGTVRQLEERMEQGEGAGSGQSAQYAQIVLELSGALNVYDRRTRGHSERVRAFADLLGEEMGLKAHQRDSLHWSALLHDVGKMKVPHDVLNKAGKPTDEEWEALRRHPLEGEKLVAPLVPWLGEWALAVGEHHERWDGTGYPRALAGEEISLAARIVAVADSFETMTAVRPYKQAMSAEAARAELSRCAGQQFDPAVVRAFLSIGIGRLRLVMGPLSWLAQLPVFGRLPVTPAVGMGVSAVLAAGTSLLGPLTEPIAPGEQVKPAAAPGTVERPARSPSPSSPAAAPPGGPVSGEAPASTAPGTPATAATIPDPPAPTTGTPSEDGRTVTAASREPVSATPIRTTPTSGSPAIGPAPNPAPVTDPDPAPNPAPVANRAPVAMPDSVTTTAGTAATVLVLANDSDMDGDALTVTSAGPAANGSVALGFGGIVTYTPGTGYVGPDSFPYSVSDSRGAATSGTVSVEVTPAAAVGTTYFLTGPGGDSPSVPVLPLGTTAPAGTRLPNYDTDRDSAPGLTLARSDDGLAEDDPSRQQRWASSLASPLKLDGPARLTIWAAMKDFTVGRSGRVIAALQECKRDGTGCVTLASGTAGVNHPPGGATWVRSEIQLGSVDHTVGTGKVLGLKVVVEQDSDDDMWLAFGTAAHAASLELTTR